VTVAPDNSWKCTLGAGNSSENMDFVAECGETQPMPDGAFGYLPSLPEDIRDVFMWLCHDMVALVRKWDFYLGLYGKPANDAVIGFLPHAFNVIEESLRTDITMAICRLCDPAQSRDQDNLSFRALGAFYSEDVKLQAIINDFVASCQPVKVNRNKLVGHSDKVARLAPGRAMIPQITKSAIDVIMENAQAILNHVAWEYARQTYGYGLPGDGGADALVHWLRKGTDNRMPRIE
jgi:AbiU2